MADTRPTHIVDGLDPKATRCGIRMNDKARFPYVEAQHVQAHIDGYGMVVCPDCIRTPGPSWVGLHEVPDA